MNDVHLCQVVQGVEATVQMGAGNLRLVVLAEALVTRFGADSTPEGWIRAYRNNAAHILRTAFEQYRATGSTLVVIGAFHD